jgi:amidophosphoribosyltransferase
MCGFISIMAPEGTDVIRDVLAGLLAIQHRGQDAAGVVTFGERFQAKKGLGLVREVFQDKHLARLRGHMAVGHVRYPTVGAGEVTDVQPFWMDFPLGVAMAHNGNVTNFQELKREYFPMRDIRLASDCDLEAVLYVFSSQLMHKRGLGCTAHDIRLAVAEVFAKVKGAYSVVGMVAGSGMFAFRDPYGIKPIVFGEKDSPTGKTYAVASESVVLDVAGFRRVRDLGPGEALFIDNQRRIHWMQVGNKPHRPCIFEYIYFARPDSVLDGVSVYEARLRLGALLADKWRETGLDIDAVIPVPESARTAAQTMAEALGVPYREGFVKNRYVGRTFIMPNDAARQDSVRQKLNPIPMEFAGKRVLILDDSIVRGNTSRQIVRIARQMGAEKVYLASYSPMLLYPCPYGIDMSTKREFIARGRSIEELCVEIGCDHLIYQDVDDMVRGVNAVAGESREFCKACFTGCYPTGDVTEDMLTAIENERLSRLPS